MNRFKVTHPSEATANTVLWCITLASASKFLLSGLLASVCVQLKTQRFGPGLVDMVPKSIIALQFANFLSMIGQWKI